MGYKTYGFEGFSEYCFIRIVDIINSLKSLVSLPKRWSYHLFSLVKLKGKMPAIITKENFTEINNHANDNEIKTDKKINIVKYF
ncbi:MAG: hypothetical protein KGQ36_02605 [Rickettsiales bacterium]|nr:hypothetical protein [Rickettsiales bacterium]